MIGALFGDLIPYIVGAIALIGGIWGYGKSQRSAGKREGIVTRRMNDLEEAANVRDKVDAAKRDGNAAERLRAKGRLRD